MGYFSKCCAKTNLPVVVQGKGYPEFNEVVALTPDGRVVEDYHGKWIWDKVKFVLKPHYNGETYNELPRSNDEMAQGYFMADAFLQYCKTHGAFKNRAAYVRAFKKYANW